MEEISLHVLCQKYRHKHCWGNIEWCNSSNIQRIGIMPLKHQQQQIAGHCISTIQDRSNWLKSNLQTIGFSLFGF